MGATFIHPFSRNSANYTAPILIQLYLRSSAGISPSSVPFLELKLSKLRRLSRHMPKGRRISKDYEAFK